jgi:hypothetical protein
VTVTNFQEDAHHLTSAILQARPGQGRAGQVRAGTTSSNLNVRSESQVRYIQVTRPKSRTMRVILQ